MVKNSVISIFNNGDASKKTVIMDIGSCRFYPSKYDKIFNYFIKF